MDSKIHIIHHHKIKTAAVYLFFIALLSYLGFSIYSAFYAFQGGQCKEVFDAQSLDNKKRICCNPDQYNSKDALCKIKCDTLEVNPDSAYCQNILQSQGIDPLAKQIEKPKALPSDVPKCTNLSASSSDNTLLLKPSNPLRFDITVQATELKPKYFVYEFYSFENNNYATLKPISFIQGKTLFGISPAVTQQNGIYKDFLSALHEDLFQEDLNNKNKIPDDVLMVVSIVDQNDKKYLQQPFCFARFKVDNTPSYCKEFKVDNSVLSDGEKIKLSVESNLPSTYSYEFKFQNLDNYNTVNGIKEYKFISYSKSGGSFSISKEAKGSSKFNLELDWKDFYQPDLNNKNKYPESIKALVYLKPTEKSSIENIAPCTVKFELDKDSGIDNCKDLEISGGTKNSDGSYSLNKNQYITLEASSKSKNIERFDFEFYNLDNLKSKKEISGIANANPIYFSKSDPYVISKTTSKTDSKSILVSHEDFNRIDLSTGSKPTKIQVRATFINSDDRYSKINSKCTTEFNVE
jgi:hypothetical protein